jgi:hypothetical protein
MKKITKFLFIAITFLMLNFVFVTASYADTTPPLPPGHGQTGNQTPPGGGAAIGGGALILALLGAGYGVKKWYNKNKKPLVE